MAERKQGADALHVNVVTPRGAVCVAEADAVIAPGELGEFEVLPGHIPLLTALHPGVLSLGEGKDADVFAVSRGFLRVDRAGRVDVLVEQAIPAADVKTDDAKQARDKAAKELEKLARKAKPGERKSVEDRRDWAQAQLDAHARVA